jgi:hypothetical protein
MPRTNLKGRDWRRPIRESRIVPDHWGAGLRSCDREKRDDEGERDQEPPQVEAHLYLLGRRNEAIPTPLRIEPIG